MPVNLDVDLLKTFISIADTGSFSKAGQEVHKTQSAVSMQMKRLEEIVTRPLFTRDGRVNRLTADGEQLLDYARRIVRISDEAVATFTEPECCGAVKLGTPDDYAERLLPEILARFARTHPMVLVDVECMSSRDLHDRVQSGELDLAIATHEPGFVLGEVFSPLTLHWVTSARHDTHRLDMVPIAASNIGCLWRQKSLDALEKAGKPYRIAYASSSVVAVSAAVLAGLAVAAIPEMNIKPGMRILTEDDGFPPAGEFQVGLLHKPGKLAPATAALRASIRDSLDELGQPLMAAE